MPYIDNATVKDFNPLHNLVLLDIPQKKCETTDNSKTIIIPETITNGITVLATVVKTGPGTKHKGKHLPMEVKKGDRVWLHRVSLIKSEDIVIIENKKYLLIPEQDIIALVDENE